MNRWGRENCAVAQGVRKAQWDHCAVGIAAMCEMQHLVRAAQISSKRGFVAGGFHACVRQVGMGKGHVTERTERLLEGCRGGELAMHHDMGLGARQGGRLREAAFEVQRWVVGCMVHWAAQGPPCTTGQRAAGAGSAGVGEFGQPPV